ncbi:hypothetical protein [Helicobacter vulpis]|uniref:hypothetical protein n=1 Tax=Helicobacter vulpis TaxID=2316076 RepID=UPI000EB5C0BC|nr:hypothetical protein [Helicobacter vulpis]
MGQKELLQEFIEIEHADTEKKNRQTSSRSRVFQPLKVEWDRWLQNLDLNYTTYISFYLRDWPAICFGRKDILGEGFVNGPTLKQKMGVYIWLGYSWRDSLFVLRIGHSTNPLPQKCAALETLFTGLPHGYKYEKVYPDLATLQENFLYDFVALVKVFNAVPREDFLLKV